MIRSLESVSGKIEALETKLVESQNISQERGLELERAQCELAGKLEEVDEAKNRIQKLESQARLPSHLLTMCWLYIICECCQAVLQTFSINLFQ